MVTQTLRLNYPQTLARRPVITQLIRKFDVTVNILQAQMTLDEAWLEIALSAEQAEFDRALDWLKQEGITVVPVG
jgi:ABC-type methionine transport system ATPase subunit